MSGGQWAELIAQHGERAQDIILANFETLEDGALRAKLSRDNHLRIIRALWEHHPRELYPQVACPRPDAARPPAGQPRRLRAHPSQVGINSRGGTLLPRSKTVWLEDSIHDVPVQRPGLVAEDNPRAYSGWVL